MYVVLTIFFFQKCHNLECKLREKLCSNFQSDSQLLGQEMKI